MHEGNAAASAPAEFLRKALEERGMTQTDLAYVLGVPQQTVNLLVLGKRGISAEMAKALGAIFDVEPEYLLRLQKAAELSAELARAKAPDPSVSRRASLVANLPVREMIKRSWIDSRHENLETEIARFFELRSDDRVLDFAHAAKKTGNDPASPLQLAWLQRVKQIAREMVVSEYSASALRKALPRLHALMTAPEEARYVPRVLGMVGVRFVLVEGLPGAKIDGATFWLSDDRPVVGMSLRFDRIDNFWFVLRHELEHVLNRDGMGEAIVDVDLQGEGAPTEVMSEQERLANAAASEFCVPKVDLDSWIARKQPFFSERDLLGFAKRLGVHPGVIAGQVRHRTKNFRLFSKHLERVRSAVTSSTIVDGWGEIAPVGE